MKKLIPCLLLFLGSFAVPQTAKSQNVSVSFQLFYDELSPYGIWVNNPTYGYVWVPSVAVGFRPYATNGYWVYTNVGWTWVSYYSWGWGPFHYGRWFYDPFYGYVWVPGTDWGPAWVSWRYYDGYYGWTALGPGISWNAGYATYNPPAERWIFVRERDFGRRDINNYYVNQSNNVTIINNSTIINNTIVNRERNETYIAGPDRTAVQKASGKTFNAVPVRDVQQKSFKVDNNQVSAYRPKVDANAGDRKVAPAKVYSQTEAKPLMDKKAYGGKAPGTSPAVKQAPTAPAEKRTAPQGLERRDMPNNKIPAREPNRQNEPLRIEPIEQKGNEIRTNPGQNEPVQREQRRDINEPRNEPQKMQPNDNRERVVPRENPQRVVPEQRMPGQRQPEQRRVEPRGFEQPQQPQPRHMAPQENRAPERMNIEPQRPQQFNQPPQQRTMPAQPAPQRNFHQPAPQQRMQPMPRNNPSPQPMPRQGGGGKGPR